MSLPNNASTQVVVESVGQSSSATSPLKQAFISYGRADSLEFSKKLNNRLGNLGYDIWFDFNDIPQGVDYQKQINDGIEKADNFIFIISPHATNSSYCRKEVELAISLNKRLIPIMHVEEISYETWQERNPGGGVEEWKAYQAKGLHSCFTNLHPELQKINWNQVSFQEGVNDFEQSFQALTEIFERQQKYVRQHTIFLNAALTWERQQKQSKFLLANNLCPEAKQWLDIRFKAEQPPCLPTDLHCEFITESLKSLPGAIAQIFFANVTADEAVKTLVSRKLQREGFTIWHPSQDAHAGADLEAAIRHGIEGADSVIYLLSPDALRGEDCQRSVDYALTLKKRVIPLVVESLSSEEQLPVRQQSLQQIDFTDIQDESAQAFATNQLLKLLKEEAAHYEQHRQILVKALRWDRQKRPKSLLLKMQDFELADQWLAQSQRESGSLATDVQQSYIEASREMNQFFDAFISYGRADSKAFATQLHDDLVAKGLNVWFDQNDIPLGVDFQEQINTGIEKSHNFIFVIAPHSVNSPYCGKEIDLALKLNKRIIPILHVEQISRETWQQRNPHRTQESDWEEAQARGESSSFQNMHPEISKINWIYCHQADVYSESFGGLVQLIHQQEDYVKSHTETLSRALVWERNQKQSQYLLVGDDRSQADAWLRTRFPTEQPPCIPTDLHCEFITESTKNANNLMAQIFLAHADEDHEVEQLVRRSLMREGFTVWTSQRDIQTGIDFNTAINHGIETADNIIYLLSPNSLASDYCQQELDYAMSLNKRIVPMLVTAMDPEEIPEQLRVLQYIDLSDNILQIDYQKDEGELLKILNQDRVYYERHKAILAQALKWERQQQNSSILMRGYNLQEAEAWLKLAKSRPQHGATELQQRFIQASVDQPQDVSLDVFVSYSRADSDMVRKLNEALQAQGKTTWFDQESIASGSDFQAEIYRGIEDCDNFLFVISPNSVNSPYCAGEVEHAAKLGKRFITVLHQPVSSASLHPELAKVQWIDFNKHDGDFYANFSEVVRTLDTDRDHVRSHTKWTQRALEWIDRERGADLLLRGNEFAVADNWLQEAETLQKQPPATTLQKDYLTASQGAIAAGIKREKRISLLIRSLLGVVSVACVIAVLQYRTANEQRQRAETVQEGQINALSRYSEQLQANNQELTGLVEAIRAGRQLEKQLDTVEQSTRDHVEQTLKDALLEITEVNQLAGHPEAKGIPSVAVSPDGQTIATGGVDGVVRLWGSDGQDVNILEGHTGEVLTLAFSPDGTKLVSGSGDTTVRIWSLEGQLLHVLEGHSAPVYGASFSPDGEEVATAGADETIKLWSAEGELSQTMETGAANYDVSFSPDGELLASTGVGGLTLWDADGKSIRQIVSDSGPLITLAFSPEGDRIATGGVGKTLELWSLDGDLLQSLPGHDEFIIRVRFSDDGQLIASASVDKTARLWSSSGELLQTLQGHQDKVWSAAFLPQVSQLATASYDGTVRVWDYSTLPQVQSLLGHTSPVTGVMIAPDGSAIASTSEDGTILWNIDGELEVEFADDSPMRNIAFSADSQYLGTAGEDGTVRIWDRQGEELQVLKHDDGIIRSVVFSPDGELVATAGDDGTVRLWKIDGTALKVLQHGKSVMSVAFSPDGERIVSGGWDNLVQLWDRNGELLKEFSGHTNAINSVSFSPDGQQILSAALDNTARVWSMDGEELTVVDHGAEIDDAEISPNGEFIVTGGVDTIAKIWSLKNGELLSSLRGHTDRIRSLSFSLDGETLATSSADQSIKLWGISSGRLSSQAETRGRELVGLLSQSCDWANHYLLHNPDVPDGDRLLCPKE